MCQKVPNVTRAFKIQHLASLFQGLYTATTSLERKGVGHKQGTIYPGRIS